MHRCLALLVLTSSLICCRSTPEMSAIDDASLEQVVTGWSLGDWTEIHSSRWVEGVWVDSSDESPWSSWDVEPVGASTLEIVMSAGMRSRVELSGGAYRDFGPVEDGAVAGEPLVVPIVEAEILGPTEWAVVMQWPALPDSPPVQESFSELRMTGDLFTWSNWVGPSLTERQRVSMSVNRIARRD